MFLSNLGTQLAAKLSAGVGEPAFQARKAGTLNDVPAFMGVLLDGDALPQAL